MGIAPGRREILQRMGIDVWYQRPVVVPARSRDLVVAAGLARGKSTPAVVAPAASPPQSVVNATPPAATVQVTPFALTCVRGGEVVLVSAAPLTRVLQRLARDIVLAAGGGAGLQGVGQRAADKVAVLDFRYPPSGTVRDRGAGTPERVLRAFLDRQTGGGAARVLITADVESWFVDWLAPRYLRIDSLADIVGDAQAKRRLWQLLRQAQP
ncbi:MAG: hypothetical protein H6993_14710 [Pseudomonadales bacterium]|nr:hypothetical protein [Pseudomonadales bacterium]MCP5185213.1 hypothetical protein [Pseudomonadales bacterium]